MTPTPPVESACQPPPPGVVLLTVIRLDASDAVRHRAILDREDLSRADRFIDPVHGRRFVLAHAGLRRALGACLGRDPASLAFTRSEDGKPALSGGGLHFNLSHSADLALLAITSDREVGVDLERHEPRTEIHSLAKRFFAPAEAAALAALPAEHQRAGFFKIWTAKEAVVKATGLGLRMPLDAFVVDADPRRPAALLHSDDPALAELRLDTIQVDPAFSATLAAPGARTLRLIAQTRT